MRQPDIPAPIEPVRAPRVQFPRGATDCHAHVFGPQSRYPLLPQTHFVPHESLFEQYGAMLRSIGCERAVLVQPSVYGSDNRAIEDALRVRGDIDLRAVAVVDPEISDKELERLHGLGFRGIRFNLAAATKGLAVEHAQALADRIVPLGWHLQCYVDFERQPELGQVLAALPVPVVFDHFGRVRADLKLQATGCRALLQVMASDNCWVKLSAPYFVSKRLPQYEDVVPIARALFAVAPGRCVWGTDWPHASARESMQADVAFADLLADCFPDASDRVQVLVDNPARLYGF